MKMFPIRQPSEAQRGKDTEEAFFLKGLGIETVVITYEHTPSTQRLEEPGKCDETPRRNSTRRNKVELLIMSTKKIHKAMGVQDHRIHR